jgi:predicted nucleic acid-binding protein
MKILLDTNIIIDILAAREPYLIDAVNVLSYIENNTVEAYLTANSITDILYILRKEIPEKNRRQEVVKNILQIIDVISVTRTDIFKAFDLEYMDFEDALQTQCAKKIKVDYIISRNVKDFKDKEVYVLTPKEFLKLI